MPLHAPQRTVEAFCRPRRFIKRVREVQISGTGDGDGGKRRCVLWQWVALKGGQPLTTWTTKAPNDQRSVR
eukprot:4289427-Pleurochrysis_carterae.AAC.1